MLHLIDATAEDVVANYKTVKEELKLYGHHLEDKPEIIALNKCDALLPEEIEAKVKALKKATKKTVHAMSAISRQGVQEVLYALVKNI